MNKKRFIISIIFIILGIQNNIMGNGTSLDVQIVKHKEIKNTHKINENQSIDLPIENDKKYHSKMNYNQHLSTNKYYLMMVLYGCLTINSLCIIFFVKNWFDLFVIPLVIQTIISPLIIILLLDNLKKQKSSLIHMNQLNKYRKYNFIKLFFLLIFIIAESFQLIYFLNELKSLSPKQSGLEAATYFFCVIILLCNVLNLIHSIWYIVLLITKNKNNIWNNIKNSIKKQDIVFYIIYFSVIAAITYGFFQLNKRIKV